MWSVRPFPVSLRVGDALRGAAERAFGTGFAATTASAAAVLALLGVPAWKGPPESGRGGHH
ncbi:hypothetical protein [Streptomyces tubercidicus]